jgi:hypothetical protein
VRETWREDSFTGDSERYVKESLEMEHVSVHRGSVRGNWKGGSVRGNWKGGSFTFPRDMSRRPWKWSISLYRLCEENLERAYTEHSKSHVIEGSGN